jgi:hypothetical protein
MISLSKDKAICGVATAAHVVGYADSWEQPIRIHHYDSGEVVMLKHEDRAVWVEEVTDAAAIVFVRGEIPFPEQPLRLAPKDMHLRIGNEVGWLGFPAMSPQSLCFFAGRTSSYLEEASAYLVDGVAINGVSGGPAFVLDEDGSITVIGVISAYIPNRATGEALPGLCLITDVAHFYDTIETLESLDEAKKEEEQALSQNRIHHELESAGG